MFKELITATLVATLPINNATDTKTNTVNNRIADVQTGENLTNAKSGSRRYVSNPTASLYNYGIITYATNTYVQYTIPNLSNSNLITIQMMTIEKISPTVDYPINQISINLNRAYTLPYEKVYAQDGILLSAIIEAGVDQGIDEYIEDLLQTRSFTGTWTNVLNQNLANKVYTYLTGNSIDQEAIQEFDQLTGQTAIDRIFNQNWYMFGQYQSNVSYEYYTINYMTTTYDFGTEEIIIPQNMNFVNPINIELIWETQDLPTGAEVVDIPGLMLAILGMPFAWISQAFNLTIFPGTPYAINLSHLCLALISAGILLFIIKKVIR